MRKHCLLLLAAIFSLLPLRHVFGADTPAWGDAIRSVLRRGQTVIVSNSHGLFQASVKEKIWRKLETPPSMPKAGMLVQQGPASPLLACYQGSWWATFLPENPGVLFVSKDAGKTWVQTSAGRQLDTLFIHPNGWFFALEAIKEPDKVPDNPDGAANATGSDGRKTQPYTAVVFSKNKRLILSKDMGATWQVISEALPNGSDWETTGIIADPDHPGQVCLTGYVSLLTWDEDSGLWHPSTTDGDPWKYYVYQAGDAAYRWEKIDAAKWHGGMTLRPGMRFSGNFDGYFNPPDFLMTPSNFFTIPYEDYGGATGIAGARVETGKTAYTFRKDGPKIVHVKALFPPEYAGPAGKFLDIKNETAFWGINVLYEGEELDYIDISCISPGEKGDNAPLHDPLLRTIALDAKHPYERDIDLSKFYDFTRPGSYKIQLFHSDTPLMKWGGSFGGQVIDVTITP